MGECHRFIKTQMNTYVFLVYVSGFDKNSDPFPRWPSKATKSPRKYFDTHVYLLYFHSLPIYSRWKCQMRIVVKNEISMPMIQSPKSSLFHIFFWFFWQKFRYFPQILWTTNHLHILRYRFGGHKSVCRIAIVWAGYHPDVPWANTSESWAAHICGGRRSLCQIGAWKMWSQYNC